MNKRLKTTFTFKGHLPLAHQVAFVADENDGRANDLHDLFKDLLGGLEGAGVRDGVGDDEGVADIDVTLHIGELAVVAAVVQVALEG